MVAVEDQREEFGDDDARILGQGLVDLVGGNGIGEVAESIFALGIGT